ncbi:hypothetical protein Tco_0072947 [Tanacetum coccineum]
MIADGIQQERENLREEISSQINNAITYHIPSQVDSSVKNYIYKFERRHVSDTPCRPSVVRPRDHDDPYDDAHPEGENNDDELPTKKVSQELVEEMLQIVDEAKLRKVNDIVWESRKEILVSPHPQKATLVVQSCQRDPTAHALSVVNKDLLYLKKGNSGPEKIVMSLHKFPAVIFPFSRKGFSK